MVLHDDVIKWKHFPRYLSFVRGIHRSPVNSPHKGQWRGALMFSLICARINGSSKQWWGWWVETLSPSLWRHRNASRHGPRITLPASLQYHGRPIARLREQDIGHAVSHFLQVHTLKRKCLHWDEIFVTDCTGFKITTSSAASGENFVKMDSVWYELCSF